MATTSETCLKGKKGKINHKSFYFSYINITVIFIRYLHLPRDHYDLQLTSRFSLLLQVAFSTTEMALALNRYLCSAVLPLITKCAPLFAGSDHRAIMIDSMLHTIYRLSRGRAFTKAQRDIIEECLMALCK